MSYRLKRWEIALAFGVLFALLWGAGTARAQEDLSGQVVRLHVIANSDAPEDQEVKLMVRDAVLAQVRVLGEGVSGAEEMAAVLSENLPLLEQTAREALKAANCAQSVTAALTDCYFPTRTYDGFALPAGEYTALRIELGSAAGQNWWCVAFPPLCVGASSQSVEEAAQAGFFTREQAALLTGQSGTYILKFKSIELLGQLRQAAAGFLP